MYRRVNDKDEAVQAIEGALLSDAGVYVAKGCVNAHFEMCQSYEEHLDWLEYLRICLSMLNIESQVHQIESNQYRDGHFYLLKSHVDYWLTEQRRRWYPHGVKVVPYDVKLTAVSIANWVMGDGTTGGGWPGSYVVIPNLRLCTQGFDSTSLALLGREFSRIGVVDTTRNGSSTRKMLTVGCEGTSKIRAAISEYVAPSFLYKLPNRRVFKRHGS